MRAFWRLTLAKNRSTVLDVVGLSVAYGMVSALRQVSVRVLKGEFVALIGANGSGKSTFLESVMGLHKTTEGRITFLGDDITNKPTDRIVAAGMTLCPEGRGTLPQMSVLENLLLGAYHNRQAMNAQLEMVFELFPVLARKTDQSAGTLSGGEQQMLSIGRSLMASPKLLMLDEPSLGLAPKVIGEILNTISFLTQKGYAILLAEQNAKKALHYADRAYVFETGTIRHEGRAESLKRNQAVIDAYLGG